MRKLLAVLVVLLGCLTFIGQAVATSSAGYADCCLQGCKGMVHCASAACQACAAPQPAPMHKAPVTRAADDQHWFSTNATFDVGSQRRPWTPPD